MANRTRNIVLRVPVTAEERAMIERKMQQMGTGCFSVYARKMLIDGYVIRLDYSDVKAMTAALQKIGTNINQIAKRVNATGTLYAQDIDDIKWAMAEIWQLQRSILSKAPKKKPLTISLILQRPTISCWCPRSAAPWKPQTLSLKKHGCLPCRKATISPTI